jgi:prolipoprotein diacylglyceryl transferase
VIPKLIIASHELSWYPLILYPNLLGCTLFFWIRFQKKLLEFNISRVKIFLFPVIVIGIGAIGTRLLNVVEHLIVTTEPHSFEQIKELIFTKSGGSQFYGAPVLILLLTPILLRVYPLKEWILFWDIAAPVWCLGYALGRIGCLLSGDGCYGTWTNLPWGMYFPYGPAPNLLPVHPTPIYEAIIHFILLFLLLKIDKRKKFLGQTFFFFLFFTSFSRFWIEFIRINPKMIWNFSQAQLISIFLIISSTAIYYNLRKRALQTNLKLNSLTVQTN